MQESTQENDSKPNQFIERESSTSKIDEHFDCVIVGAGLGGLATASLLAQRGQKVLVLEKHNTAGGYATNFQRGEFNFDVSLHSFNGAVADAETWGAIEAIGIADKVTFLPHKFLYRYVAKGLDFRVRERDLNAYCQQLSEMFPDETENIRRLFDESVRMHATVVRFLYSKWPFWLRVLLTPFIFHRVLKYEHDTVDKFFSRFTRNEQLKTILNAQWTYYGLPPKQLAFVYCSYPFIDFLKNGGYSIKGGSQMLSNALCDVIQAHGGRIIVSSPVSQIHTDAQGVCGVTSKKTGRVDTRKVVSNVSPYAVREMVGVDKFSSRFHRRLDTAKLSTSAFQVYLGLNCTFQDLGVDKDEYIIFISNLFSNVDPSLAPVGKATLGIFSLMGREDWFDIKKPEYRIKKEKLVRLLLEKAEVLIPGLSAHIEVCEAGSPRTMTNFTTNSAGAIYGFDQRLSQSGFFRRFPQRYPIKGLYQVGGWTFPGAGFIGVILSSMFLVDRYFRRTLPKLSSGGGSIAPKKNTSKLAR
jgi:prolycopene isomerase